MVCNYNILLRYVYNNMNYNFRKKKVTNKIMQGISIEDVQTYIKMSIITSTFEGREALLQRMGEFDHLKQEVVVIKPRFEKQINFKLIQREFVEFDSIAVISPKQLIMYMEEKIASLDRKDHRLAIENRILKDGRSLVNNAARMINMIDVKSFQDFLNDNPSLDNPVLVTEKCHKSFADADITYILANLIRRIEIYVEDQLDKPFSKCILSAIKLKEGTNIMKMYQELVNTKDAMIRIIAKANKEGRQERYAKKAKQNKRYTVLTGK
jgi:hypothetical protein